MATQPRPQSGASPETPTVMVEPVEQTSLSARNSDPDEVTLYFTKWTAHANTAYQRGDFAGFKRNVAQRLIANGNAVLAETPQQRDRADRPMVTK